MKFTKLPLIAILSCVASIVSADGPHVQSLDGAWDIVFDRQNVGAEGNWYLNEIFAKHPAIRSIQVPSCWELTEKDYEGVAFYRRAFQVPASWQDQIVRLRFGAVNYLTEVWLNDEVVGYHEGGFTPFEFRVDELLNFDAENHLILRVVGPILLQDKTIDGVGPLETPQWRGGITGGVWQSVELVATGDTIIQDVFIVPQIANDTIANDTVANDTVANDTVANDTVADDAVQLRLELENISQASKAIELETTITAAQDPDQIVAQTRDGVTLKPSHNRTEQLLKIPAAEYWSPDTPFLYRVTVRVIDGGNISDCWTSQFGMCAFTIQDRQFQLNGQPLHLKATFFEGLYPNGIAVPDDIEMAKREIRLAKEAGFNMIRPWRRPPVPEWLDLADQMGVLVVGSPALECMRLPLSTPYLPARVEREIRETILRDRNRACIVQWELFNELHRPILKQMMHPMAMMARNLDPTRLILDESGGWAFGARMYLPGDYEPMRFNDIHNYPGPFIDQRIFNGLLSIGLTEEQKAAKNYRTRTPGRNVVPGLMSFVSELGYGSLPNLPDNNERFLQYGNPLTPAYRYHKRLQEEQQQVLRESGFDRYYPDFEQFCLDQQIIHGAANRRMIEAVRSNPRVSGYCIHALAAGDWILGAGLIDLWRQPKSAVYEETKAANQPRILVIRSLPRNVYADRGCLLEVTGVNELESIDMDMSLRVESADGKQILSKKLESNWDTGVSQLYSERLETQTLSGKYIVRIVASAKDGSIVAQNSRNFHIFSDRESADISQPIALLDGDGVLTRYLRAKYILFTDFSAQTLRQTPVFVGRGVLDKPDERERREDLVRHIAGGGTVVYLTDTVRHLQQGTAPRTSEDQASYSFPARGLWTCIPHIVHEHPVFAGLPTCRMMDEVYENVWPTQTLRNLSGDVIVGSIGFEWFSEDHKQHYSGPGKSWWGADLAIVPHGEGRAILSQLRIVENLGRDPVADRILQNLIVFTTRDSR